VVVDGSPARLQALQERRELVSQQYRSTMEERGRVGQERLNAQARGDVGMVKEYDATVERLGARLKTLEQSLQSADRQIDEAMKAPISIGGAEAPPAFFEMAPPPFDPGDLLQAQRVQYFRLMALEAGVLLFVGAILWRFGVARGKRLTEQHRRNQALSERNDDRLVQAVDAIAIEVERLSEGQRFLNNIMANRRPERDVLPVVRATTPTDGSHITPH
jgi:hypothetical protein